MVMSSFIQYEKRSLLGMSKKKTNILIGIFGMALNRNNLENLITKLQNDLTLTYNWGNANYSFWKDVKAGISR